VIGSEFANAIKETAEAETEEREAEDGQNDNNVVRGHDFFPHHLNEKMTKLNFLKKLSIRLKQLLKKNLAIFLVVTELAIDPAVASQ
jgi:hypothetical protein